jgi:hypothetical protein
MDDDDDDNNNNNNNNNDNIRWSVTAVIYSQSVSNCEWTHCQVTDILAHCVRSLEHNIFDLHNCQNCQLNGKKCLNL